MDDDDEYELSDGDFSEPPSSSGLTRSQACNLYILFTATAFPDTLVAAATRMIIIYFAMILFSSSIGRWVDRSPNRLRTLLSTIICNRGSVIVGSFFWLLILSQEDVLPHPDPAEDNSGSGDNNGPVIFLFSLPSNRPLKTIGFALAVGCGIVERLSASGNLISLERDWVVTVAAAAGSGQRYDLTHLNAVMRRIDLVCKLFAPIVASVVISAWDSARVGVLFTALTSLVSLPIEVVSARRVWMSSSRLRAPKPVPPAPPPSPSTQNTTAQTQKRQCQWWSGSFVTGLVRQYVQGFEMYFATPVWVPSVALALLHFNMMTWRATFITSLINVGYSLNVITVARTVGSVFEISSTIVTPRGIAYLGKTTTRQQQQSRRGQAEDEAGVALISEEEEEGDRDEDENEDLDRQTIVGLERFGLWGFTWQLIMTIPVVLGIWAIWPRSSDHPATSPTQPPPPPWAWSLTLFAFLALSRFGVWIYDLTTQQLTQMPSLVPPHKRSSFAGVEASVVNLFELLGAGAAISLPATEQLPLLALASFAVIAGSWGTYAAWVRWRRGHLVHWEKIGRPLGLGKSR